MSEKEKQVAEVSASDTKNSVDATVPEPESQQLPEIDVTVSADVVQERDPQIESVTNTESTIESQDESMVTEPGVTEESGPRKNRRRVKGLLRSLQDQVEFYFGDANLHKDRFIKGKIAEHPDRYVSVEVIASFNKMKSLTEEVSLVVQAMEKSSMLELSEDKKWVRRVTPLASMSQSDIDARTIYVEDIQASSDHDQLKKLFSPFGTVVYVSLPKHKTSGKNKGFAFVEFTAADEARKAVEFFKSKEEQQEKSDKTMEKEGDSVFLDSKKEAEASESQIDNGRKRGRDETKDESTEGCDEEGSSVKRIKTEEQEISVTSDPSGGLGAPTADPTPSSMTAVKSEVVEEVAGKKRPREEHDEETDQDEEEERRAKTSRLDSTWSEASVIEGEGGEDDVTAKKRKRQRKHRKRKESIARQLNDIKWKVISKLEWLEMKELYKQLQKVEMKKLKEENKEARAKPQRSKTFVEHCLVRLVNNSQEKLSKEKLREVCSEYGDVAYVDIHVGENESYVRFAGTGCVEKLLEAATVLDEKLKGVSFSSVSEEEEKDYFRKTQIARKQRWGGGQRKKWTRGQDKVVSQALQRQQQQKKYGSGESKEKSSKSKVQAKHIRFSDSDED